MLVHKRTHRDAHTHAYEDTHIYFLNLDILKGLLGMKYYTHQQAKTKQQHHNTHKSYRERETQGELSWMGPCQRDLADPALLEVGGNGTHCAQVAASWDGQKPDGTGTFVFVRKARTEPFGDRIQKVHVC